MRRTVRSRLAFPIVVVAFGTHAHLGAAAPAGSDELLDRVWQGVQAAQKRNSTWSGTVTETRTSRLFVRPVVFHGIFHASGTDKFRLEYTDPDAMRIIYSGDYLNVTTGREKKNTEVIRVGDQVRRAQKYFSSDSSLANLKASFNISAGEDQAAYHLNLVPRSERFRQRVNYIRVDLDKGSFMLRLLEVDGKNGVNSVYRVEIESVNSPLDPKLFDLYLPQGAR
ncbi:MAG: outer membrane lipoprotein carrier protein LolA [Acidobacteriota bacterium]